MRTDERELRARSKQVGQMCPRTGVHVRILDRSPSFAREVRNWNRSCIRSMVGHLQILLTCSIVILDNDGTHSGKYGQHHRRGLGVGVGSKEGGREEGKDVMQHDSDGRSFLKCCACSLFCHDSDGMLTAGSI